MQSTTMMDDRGSCYAKDAGCMPGIDVQLGNGWTMVHVHLIVACVQVAEDGLISPFPFRSCRAVSGSLNRPLYLPLG